jgi:hypothetical protein
MFKMWSVEVYGSVKVFSMFKMWFVFPGKYVRCFPGSSISRLA